MPNPQTIRMQRFTGSQALVDMVFMGIASLLLWLWLVEGVAGAGNLYRAMTFALTLLWFLVMLSLLGPVDLAFGPRPRWIEVLTRMHFWAVLLVLVWTAHWWLSVAVVFCRCASVMNRVVRRELSARQEAAHG